MEIPWQTTTEHCQTTAVNVARVDHVAMERAQRAIAKKRFGYTADISYRG